MINTVTDDEPKPDRLSTISPPHLSQCSVILKMVIPGGFEPPAFHLGGERSIQLSYGTTLLGKLQIRTELGIIPYQRSNVIPVKLVPAFQKIEFDDKQKAGDNTAEAFDEVNHSTSRSARCEQIIDYQDAMAFADGVLVDLECVLSVLKII